MMFAMQRIAFCLALQCQFQTMEAKVHSGSVLLSSDDPQEQWQFLSKFGYGVGTGTYELRLRLQEPQDSKSSKRTAKVSLDVFLDEDWSSVEQLPKCQRSADGPARAKHQMSLPLSGNWGRWERGEVYQVVRPHIWYFALSTCEGRGSAVLNGTRIVDFELRAQDDGSEFSVEMQYALPANAVVLLGFSAFLIHYGLQCAAFRRSTGSLHVVIKVLTLAMMLQFAGQLLHTTHLWRYSANGVGVRMLDVLSEVMLMLSQVVQTTLLIAIALGYTLSHSSEEDLAVVKPLTLVVCLAHTALVAVGKMQDGASDKHHEHEGAVGMSLLAMRLVLYAWFVVAAKASQRKGGFRLQAFLQQFQAAGSLYFLAYPILFAVVQVFAPYLRHPIMQMGLLAMQTASHSWLAGLFLSRGAYFKASVLGSSLLPGGAGSLCGGVPEKEA